MPATWLPRYVSSGWLESPARGVYPRKGGRLSWQGVLRTLQVGEGCHCMWGRFALAWRGYEHYLRLGTSGPEPIPGWAGKPPPKERVAGCGKGPFDFPALRFSGEAMDDALRERGLERLSHDSGANGLVFATPERAMLELCDAPADAALVYEAERFDFLGQDHLGVGDNPGMSLRQSWKRTALTRGTLSGVTALSEHMDDSNPR